MLSDPKMHFYYVITTKLRSIIFIYLFSILIHARGQEALVWLVNKAYNAIYLYIKFYKIINLIPEYKLRSF